MIKSYKSLGHLKFASNPMWQPAAILDLGQLYRIVPFISVTESVAIIHICTKFDTETGVD